MNGNKSFKKMVLVPSEQWSGQTVIHPDQKQLSSLDAQLKEVMTDNLPNDQKLKMYWRILSKYIALHDRLFNATTPPQQQLQPIHVGIKKDVADVASRNVSLMRHLSSDSDIIPLPQGEYRTSTPIPARSPDIQEAQIDNIVRSIAHHPEILQWDPATHEMIYRGKTVANSNMLDLITNNAQISGQRNENVPIGASTFSAALSEIGHMTGGDDPVHKTVKQRRYLQHGKSPYMRKPVVQKQDNEQLMELIRNHWQKRDKSLLKNDDGDDVNRKETAIKRTQQFRRRNETPYHRTPKKISNDDKMLKLIRKKIKADDSTKKESSTVADTEEPSILNRGVKRKYMETFLPRYLSRKKRKYDEELLTDDEEEPTVLNRGEKRKFVELYGNPPHWLKRKKRLIMDESMESKRKSKTYKRSPTVKSEIKSEWLEL